MIEVIHEHSYYPDLLPEKAVIADIGCRGFLWTNHFRELGHTVHAIDMDDLQHGDYDRCAINKYTGECGIWRGNDPQATKIDPLNINLESVRCYTLEDYMKLKGVDFFDLIKSDCEGAEVDIIMSLSKPPTKQYSIEWHLHCGQDPKDVYWATKRLNELGYETIKHELTEAHGAGYNFWSSLFILK